MGYEFVGYNKKMMAVLENETGEIIVVDAPRFKDNEVVTTAKKHFSAKSLTRLLSPVYTDTRGWVYTENYIDKNVKSGGCGCWFEESLFDKISNAGDKLVARKIEIDTEINSLNCKLKELTKEKEMINYAIKLVDER